MLITLVNIHQKHELTSEWLELLKVFAHLLLEILI
jgi:hypothetical protein